MSLANVIKPTSRLPQYVHKDFPAMFWNQETGEPVTVNSEAEIPEGYKPYHPNSERAQEAAALAAAQAPAGLPLTKEEVLAHLEQGGIAHNPAKSHKNLYNLLLTSVKNALAQAEIEFDAESTDVKALLELLPKV